MAVKLPYMLATGLIPKILEKIEHARRPERFTQDFLSTKLGHSGGSARPFISLLKRMGFLASDGTPTSRYDQFRTNETQGIAVAEGMKTAYSELFERNEYVYEMTKDKLTSLVIETTGAARSDRSTKAIVGTFVALNEIADFDTDPVKTEAPNEFTDSTEWEEAPTPAPAPPTEAGAIAITTANKDVDFKVSYTINLNLPETTNPDVFNAIFRSLKENLLKD